MLNKLKKKNGESLMESLVAIVIVVFIISMLPMAVVTAAKINHSAQSMKTICGQSRRTTANPGEAEAPATAYDAKVTISVVNEAGVKTPGTLEDSYNGYSEDGFYYYAK